MAGVVATAYARNPKSRSAHQESGDHHGRYPFRLPIGNRARMPSRSCVVVGSDVVVIVFLRLLVGWDGLDASGAVRKPQQRS